MASATTFLQIPFEAANARELAKQHGARWRRDVKQWAVPTVHVSAIRQAITEETGEGEPARAFSMEGRTSVKIPFSAAQARELAKQRGARWRAAEKAWAVPAEHASEVRQAIAEDPDLTEICFGEPCNCAGMQIWQGECLATGRSATW